MTKRVFNLVDTSFYPGFSITGGRTPKLWHWDRTFRNPDIPVFYTNAKMFEAQPGQQNYGILSEPRALMDYYYQNIPHILDRFQLVFTHDSVLLNRYPDQCRFIPSGGIWIGGTNEGGEIALYPKSKMVSIVSSTKAMCSRHLFRYQIALALKEMQGVDIFIADPGNNFPTLDFLADYRYSIAIENHSDDLFFTEKLLNCFATGTIPLYFGAKQAAQFFNPEGILPFDTWPDLMDVLRSISAADYESRLPAIRDNLQRCRRFETNEDFLVSEYGGELPFFAWDDV